MARYGISVPARQLACVPVVSPEDQAYLGAMAAAANYARANRRLLTQAARAVLADVARGDCGSFTTFRTIWPRSRSMMSAAGDCGCGFTVREPPGRCLQLTQTCQLTSPKLASESRPSGAPDPEESQPQDRGEASVKQSVRLGRVAGIQSGAHWSVAVILHVALAPPGAGAEIARPRRSPSG
jgi:tRNA-splicing ligase RtcB